MVEEITPSTLSLEPRRREAAVILFLLLLLSELTPTPVRCVFLPQPHDNLGWQDWLPPSLWLYLATQPRPSHTHTHAHTPHTLMHTHIHTDRPPSFLLHMSPSHSVALQLPAQLLEASNWDRLYTTLMFIKQLLIEYSWRVGLVHECEEGSGGHQAR